MEKNTSPADRHVTGDELTGKDHANAGQGTASTGVTAENVKAAAGRASLLGAMFLMATSAIYQAFDPDLSLHCKDGRSLRLRHCVVHHCGYRHSAECVARTGCLGQACQ